MSFNFSEFIINNLKDGYNNGSFSKQQVNIFSMNYLSKGQIDEEHFSDLQSFLNPVEEDYPGTLEEPPILDEEEK